MSLRTIGYENGRAIRVDEGPTSPLPAKGWRGSLVVAGPGYIDRNRHAKLELARKVKADKTRQWKARRKAERAA